MSEGGDASSAGGIWNNPADASGFLSNLIALTSASPDALSQLASIEPYDHKMPANSEVATLFLTAVAKHMPATLSDTQNPRQAGDQSSLTQLIPILSDLVGRAATICRPRSAISKSGILLALAKVRSSTVLSSANVEFLQCALLAGQYRFASRIVRDDWPKPEKGTSLSLILRYFYLRGMIHLGCDELQVAIRCFWTVISVPCDVASAIAVDAWKKLVLTKCLVLQDSVPFESLVSPPVGASLPIARVLTQNLSNPIESVANIDTNDSLGVAAYTDLAKACHEGDRQEFAKILKDNADLFTADHNYGLAERVSSDLEYRHILHTASVYKTLPLAQLAKELDKSEDDTLATLSQVDSLQFQHVNNGMISLQTIYDHENLPTEDLTRLMQLTERISKLDVTLAGTSLYQATKVEAARPPRGVDDF
mmetsp:Transcript_2468/g.3637  ORF Transcript_2468/g.3637 Transcript_2468/m.3637 type:complete len:423 (-) Transcript_2468:40-1308(-)|eukprot:CAMPEP_0194249110 /NCGR_PEP_ID=MMETSP0158-20130606/19800_1 /TAXON_ID=33649 /ORGANISM="Thalassionema nitzschioides, Strain L26-B" /LENGTH=422 /DNA_ID=CAMNT_0038985559 /DNA_START=61 /DNA_END=1329 /DNA_ORIENTATION=-